MPKLKAAYTDDELIDGCLKEDVRFQQIFYERFYGKMMALCSRYCNNREDAMELLNTGFMKVFMNLKSFRRDGILEGWIRRIVLNHIIENHRSNVRYKEVMTFNDYEQDGEVDEDALQHLMAEDIINMINRLPASTRVVFNLFAIDGYPHAEIAEKLGISVGTSKWHVSTAKEKLKQMINQELKKEINYVSSR